MMKVSDIIRELNLTPLTGPFDKEITSGYASDLLSDVLANGEDGCVWITIQIHRNIVAVASLNDFAAIIVSGGRKPEDTTISEAAREKLSLLTTPMNTYEASGKLYALGIK